MHYLGGKGSGVQPSGQTSGNYRNLTTTQEEEDAFNYTTYRTEAKKTSMLGAVAHMVKGALGAGIMSGHVAWMKAGVGAAAPLCLLCGFYMYYCLNILVRSSTVLCKRTRVPALTYSDTGEAAMACCPNPKVAKWSRCFRITIDSVIAVDLFGSCACYHIIIARSIKQLVENRETTTEEAFGSSPSLRAYMAILIIPVIIICLIRHLKWLAPLSLGANMVVAMAIVVAIYYAFERNPTFSDLVLYRSFSNIFEFLGMSVFSMSCSGVVIPIENNMNEPKKFPKALAIGMVIIVMFVFSCAFFGYVAFRDDSKTPITINFPMNVFCMVLKGLIAFMILVTFALNFWVPFNITYYYIKPKLNQNRVVFWEYVLRTMFAIIVCGVAIAFPAIDNLIGFIGSICLSNMAFIWPNVITILVIWERPGFGPGKIHLWKHIFLLGIGVILLFAGSYVNGKSLVMSVFE